MTARRGLLRAALWRDLGKPGKQARRSVSAGCCRLGLSAQESDTPGRFAAAMSAVA